MSASDAQPAVPARMSTFYSYSPLIALTGCIASTSAAAGTHDLSAATNPISGGQDAEVAALHGKYCSAYYVRC